MNFWQGTTIRLRSIEPADADHLIRWNLNSERNRFLDFTWPPTSEASVREMAEKQSRQRLEDDKYFFIIEDLQGTPVGTISTHDCNHRNGTFSYGIDIAPEHQRKGYASQAILLVVKYYFEELRYQKVTVPVLSDNQASIGLHERLGFTREATIRRMVYSQGRYFDTLWFGLTDDEFTKLGR